MAGVATESLSTHQHALGCLGFANEDSAIVLVFAYASDCSVPVGTMGLLKEQFSCVTITRPGSVLPSVAGRAYSAPAAGGVKALDMSLSVHTMYI